MKAELGRNKGVYQPTKHICSGVFSRKEKMNSSNWLYSDHYHHPLTVAIIFGVAGFFWGNLESGSNAHATASLIAHDAMIAALVPSCLALSRNDDDRVAKLQAINGAQTYLQRDEVKQSGWANVPGSESASYDLAAACLESLDFIPERDLRNHSFDAN